MNFSLLLQTILEYEIYKIQGVQSEIKCLSVFAEAYRHL